MKPLYVLVKMTQLYYILLLSALVHSTIYCHDQLDACARARTCSDCISIGKQCKWCTKEQWSQFRSSRPQCSAQFLPVNCPASSLIDPTGQMIETIHNRSFSDTIQLRPQLVKVEARVGAMVTVEIEYKQAVQQVQHRNTSVELVIEHKPDNVHIEIWSNCAKQQQQLTRTSICANFQGYTSIPFEIRLKLTSCTKPSSYHNSVIRIGLLTIHETVVIELKKLCKCECETMPVVNSPKCSNSGNFSCGICSSCNGIRSGRMCECDPEKPIDPRAPDAHCTKSGDSRACSGHGECFCSKCICDQLWAGEHCQQDQSDCYHHQSSATIKCNNQGECVNGQCQCNRMFTGKFCDCSLANATCASSNHSIGRYAHLSPITFMILLLQSILVYIFRVSFCN